MEKVIIYTDGGSRGNPGPAAVGVVICNDQNQIIKTYNRYLGRGTNNEAEYQAAIYALQKVKLLFGKKKALNLDIEMRLDSELVVKQLNHQYKIKEESTQTAFIQVWNLMLDFNSVIFKHIRREENKEADKLVNQALDGQDNESALPGF